MYRYVAVLMLIVVASAGCSQIDADLIIEADILIDGMGDVEHDVAIIIKDGLIRDIVPQSRVRSSSQVETISAPVAMPGLINAAAHAEIWIDRAESAWTHTGVTSIADLGSSFARMHAYQSQFTSPLPRIVVAGPSNVSADHLPAIFWGDGFFQTVEGPEEARDAAEQLIANDVDFIVVAGNLSIDELQAVMSIATEAAIPVIGELSTGTAVQFERFIDAGVNVIMYAPHEEIEHDICQQAVDQDIIIIPRMQDINLTTPARDVVKTFIELGGRVAVGDGAGSPYRPAGMLLTELDMFASALGMSELDIIISATRHSAAALGMTDVGTIKPGQRADIILLDQNPIDDLSSLESISKVIIDGQIVYEQSEDASEPQRVAEYDGDVDIIDADIIIFAHAMIDGTGAEPMYDVAIIIDDDRITDVRPAQSVQPGSSSTVIDAGDEIVVPGLINTLTCTFRPAIRTHLYYGRE